MVARISKGSSLSTSLNYNEQKLRHKEAEIILAENYPKDMHLLNFREKLFVLEHRAKLNERVKANSVHISLNFDPQEKLEKDQLQSIAKTYMERIGFGDQPYLVYQHHDAGHPHMHIVTTNITREGKRIDMNNIGRTLSEKARKSIDKEFKLISPESKWLSKQLQQKETIQNGGKLKPVSIRKVLYGKSETKTAIQNVVDHVMNQYKYTSLGEYNAVLKLYNITADPGQKNSLMAQNKGLVYRVLDESGNKVGTPIKASAFYNKPTLKNLELKFKENEPLRQRSALHLKNGIDLAIIRNNTMANLSRTLLNAGISVLVRQTREGRMYGITFVDHQNRCVFNGSDLGRQYSAQAILERCKPLNKVAALIIDNAQENINPNTESKISFTNTALSTEELPDLLQNNQRLVMLEELITPQLNQGIAREFLEDITRQKKKRKRLHL